MKIENIIDILNCLPCSGPCFEGKKNWKTGCCLEKLKCEYLNGMGCFIENIFPCYTIVKCLDVDRNDLSQPEALLKNESGEYMAIEMKRLPNPQFLESSVEKTNIKNAQDCFFWEKTIDDSTLKAGEQFRKMIKEDIPDISQAKLGVITYFFFLGINVDILPIGNNLSVRELVYPKRNEFKIFLTNEMAYFGINVFRKFISNNLHEEDFCKCVIFNNKLNLRFTMTTNQNVYFQLHDTTPFSLREYLKINEEGVIDFLKKYLLSCDKKFRALNKETFTEKNIFLLTHESSLSEATNVIANCIGKLVVPKSIHEIWVTDYHYESVYNDDGDEIGEQITEYKYRKIYPL